MRLLRVELRRLWLRRVTWGGLLLALLIAGLAVLSQISAATPPSEREIAEAEEFYAQELENWEEHGEEDVAACEESEADDPDPAADYGCDQMEPRLEWFLPTATTFVPAPEMREAGTDGIEPGDGDDPRIAEIQESIWSGWSGIGAAGEYAAAFLMLAFVVGVSFVTAEQSSGALGMWLTFEPRRSRVYWSKAAAAALGTVPLVVVGWLATAGGIYTLHAVLGTVGEVSGEDWAEIAGFSVRLVAAGAACAAIGTALGVLLRHAVAAVGVAAVVLWASVAFAFSFGSAQRWLPTVNLTAWLAGGTRFSVAEDVRDDAGVVTTTWTTEVVSATQGGLYLLAVVAVLTLAALVVFRRKDVS